MKFKAKLIFLLIIVTNCATFAQRGRYVPRPPVRPTHPTYEPYRSTNERNKPPIYKSEPPKFEELVEIDKNNNNRKEFLNPKFDAVNLTRELFFSDKTKRTTNINEIVILITRGDFIDGSTKFLSNYGKKSENAFGVPDKFITYKEYKYSFKNSFGKTSLKSIFENALFIFDYNIQIGENERYILSKSKNIAIQLPNNTVVKCKFSAKTNKLYFDNHGHFLERPPSYFEYFKIQSYGNKQTKFDNDLVVSFINNDTKTQNDFKKEYSKNYININVKNFNKLESILEKHKFDRIFLIGHIEGEKFASYDKKNKKEFEISLEKIKILQRKYNLLIYNLGCNSITNGSEIGYAQTINSIELKENISKAIKSKTIFEFYNTLSNEENTCFVNINQISNQITFDGVYEKEITKRKTKAKKNEQINRAIVYSRINDSLATRQLKFKIK